MTYDRELSAKDLINLSKVAKCEVSEIQVFAIPDTLALNSWINSVSDSVKLYRTYAAEHGKSILNPNSWKEFKGFKYRLLLFPKGYSVCEVPS